MDNKYIVNKTAPAIEKKSLILILQYLDSISSQTRIKLKKSLKKHA